MDEKTLVLLAGKLLEVCDLHKGNSIFSVIAELDRKPAHVHRIFSSFLANHPLIVEVATDILRNEEIKTREFEGLREKYKPKINELEKEYEKELGSSEGLRKTKNKLYCYKRILEDLDYFFKCLDEIAPFLGKEILDVRTDVPAAYLALLSHVYLISYTFPPQPFFPYASNACQHVEFWKKIDYFDFKQMFSGEDNTRVYEFRKNLVENKKAWSREIDPTLEGDPVIRKRIEKSFGKPFDPYGMIKAMIERMGALAPGVKYEAVQRTIRDYMYNLGCKEIVHSDRERWFLVNLEREIENSILVALGQK